MVEFSTNGAINLSEPVVYVLVYYQDYNDDGGRDDADLHHCGDDDGYHLLDDGYFHALFHADGDDQLFRSLFCHDDHVFHYLLVWYGDDYRCAYAYYHDLDHELYCADDYHAHYDGCDHKTYAVGDDHARCDYRDRELHADDGH